MVSPIAQPTNKLRAVCQPSKGLHSTSANWAFANLFAPWTPASQCNQAEYIPLWAGCFWNDRKCCLQGSLSSFLCIVNSFFQPPALHTRHPLGSLVALLSWRLYATAISRESFSHTFDGLGPFYTRYITQLAEYSWVIYENNKKQTWFISDISGCIVSMRYCCIFLHFNYNYFDITFIQASKTHSDLFSQLGRLSRVTFDRLQLKALLHIFTRSSLLGLSSLQLHCQSWQRVLKGKLEWETTKKCTKTALCKYGEREWRKTMQRSASWALIICK